MSAQLDLFDVPAPPQPATVPALPLPTDPDVGPRQTVERLRHPTLGEVVAVFDNGPAYLRTADGTRHDVKRIDFGGFSSARDGRPARDWQRVRGLDGSVVEADMVQHGVTHRRMWSPLLGMGWLIYPPGGMATRWEGDDGRVVSLDVAMMQVGDAAYIAASAKANRSRAKNVEYPKLTDAAREWMRLTMRDGTTMDFRRKGPPTT